MPKGRRPRTKELYDAILRGYRRYGEKHGQAAKEAGVTRRTASECFRSGWPGVGIPIREQLALDELVVRAGRTQTEEVVEASKAGVAALLKESRGDAASAIDALERASKRAQDMEAKASAALEEANRRLAEVEELSRAKITETERAAAATMAKAELDAKAKLADLLQKAKVDAAETMADEANAAKFGRKAALSAAAIAALVLKDAQHIAVSLRTAMGDLSQLSPPNAIRLARELVRLVESAEKSVILALQAERLRVGQPTEVIGITGYDTTLEEKEIKVRAVARALERQKLKRNGLVAVPGGLPPEPAPASGVVPVTALAPTGSQP